MVKLNYKLLDIKLFTVVFGSTIGFKELHYQSGSDDFGWWSFFLKSLIIYHVVHKSIIIKWL